MELENGVINFAVYENATEFCGMEDITLPEIGMITEEMSGAGISGKVNVPFIGHVEAMSMTINFRTVTKQTIKISTPGKHQLDIRGVQQSFDNTSGKYIQTPIKYVAVVQPVKFNPGKLAPASSGEVSGEFAVTYFACYIKGELYMEIDQLNFIYKMNGMDYLEEVRKGLGK